MQSGGNQSVNRLCSLYANAVIAHRFGTQQASDQQTVGLIEDASGESL